MEIFEISKNFPNDEKFSLTDQIRRSSPLCLQILLKHFGKTIPQSLYR
ncbi:MAG: four helix bundle protein [Bacteroidales bacterium]